MHLAHFQSCGSFLIDHEDGAGNGQEFGLHVVRAAGEDYRRLSPDEHADHAPVTEIHNVTKMLLERAVRDHGELKAVIPVGRDNIVQNMSEKFASLLCWIQTRRPVQQRGGRVCR